MMKNANSDVLHYKQKKSMSCERKNKILKNSKKSFTHDRDADDTMILNLFKKRYQRAKKNPNIGSEDLSKM